MLESAWLDGRCATATEEADAGAGRDDPHANGGHHLLTAIDGVAVQVNVRPSDPGDDGDGGVEEEQEPEHRLGGEQRLHESSFRIVVAISAIHDAVRRSM